MKSHLWMDLAFRQEEYYHSINKKQQFLDIYLQKGL